MHKNGIRSKTRQKTKQYLTKKIQSRSVVQADEATRFRGKEKTNYTDNKEKQKLTEGKTEFQEQRGRMRLHAPKGNRCNSKWARNQQWLLLASVRVTLNASK